MIKRNHLLIYGGSCLPSYENIRIICTIIILIRKRKLQGFEMDVFCLEFRGLRRKFTRVKRGPWLCFLLH